MKYMIFVWLLAFSFACQQDPDEVPENPVVVSPTPNPPANQSYQLVWQDEFDGTAIDTTKWSFQIGNGEAYGIPGWGNNELQYYTGRPENARVDSGMLIIEARREDLEGFKFTSSRMRSLNKGDWRHGRIEIRAKLPEGQGIWSAIWMLPTDNVYGGWPQSGEIDIMEALGHEPDKVHSTVHYGPAWPNNRNYSRAYTLQEGTFSEDFHLFSLEWTQNKMVFMVDGETISTVVPGTIPYAVYPFNERFHLLLNIAVGGNWPGNPDQTTVFPQRMYIDYVKVYQLQ